MSTASFLSLILLAFIACCICFAPQFVAAVIAMPACSGNVALYENNPAVGDSIEISTNQPAGCHIIIRNCKDVFGISVLAQSNDITVTIQDIEIVNQISFAAFDKGTVVVQRVTRIGTLTGALGERTLVDFTSTMAGENLTVTDNTFDVTLIDPTSDASFRLVNILDPDNLDSVEIARNNMTSSVSSTVAARHHSSNSIFYTSSEGGALSRWVFTDNLMTVRASFVGASSNSLFSMFRVGKIQATAGTAASLLASGNRMHVPICTAGGQIQLSLFGFNSEFRRFYTTEIIDNTLEVGRVTSQTAQVDIEMIAFRNIVQGDANVASGTDPSLTITGNTVSGVDASFGIQSRAVLVYASSAWSDFKYITVKDNMMRDINMVGNGGTGVYVHAAILYTLSTLTMTADSATFAVRNSSLHNITVNTAASTSATNSFIAGVYMLNSISSVKDLVVDGIDTSSLSATSAINHVVNIFGVNIGATGSTLFVQDGALLFNDINLRGASSSAKETQRIHGVYIEKAVTGANSITVDGGGIYFTAGSVSTTKASSPLQIIFFFYTPSLSNLWSVAVGNTTIDLQGATVSTTGSESLLWIAAAHFPASAANVSQFSISGNTVRASNVQVTGTTVSTTPHLAINIVYFVSTTLTGTGAYALGKLTVSRNSIDVRAATSISSSKAATVEIVRSLATIQSFDRIEVSDNLVNASGTLVDAQNSGESRISIFYATNNVKGTNAIPNAHFVMKNNTISGGTAKGASAATQILSVSGNTDDWRTVIISDNSVLNTIVHSLSATARATIASFNGKLGSVGIALGGSFTASNNAINFVTIVQTGGASNVVCSGFEIAGDVDLFTSFTFTGLYLLENDIESTTATLHHYAVYLPTAKFIMLSGFSTTTLTVTNAEIRAARVAPSGTASDLRIALLYIPSTLTTLTDLNRIIVSNGYVSCRSFIHRADARICAFAIKRALPALDLLQISGNTVGDSSTKMTYQTTAGYMTVAALCLENAAVSSTGTKKFIISSNTISPGVVTTSNAYDIFIGAVKLFQAFTGTGAADSEFSVTSNVISPSKFYANYIDVNALSILSTSSAISSFAKFKINSNTILMQALPNSYTANTRIYVSVVDASSHITGVSLATSTFECSSNSVRVDRIQMSSLQYLRVAVYYSPSSKTLGTFNTAVFDSNSIVDTWLQQLSSSFDVSLQGFTFGYVQVASEVNISNTVVRNVTLKAATSGAIDCIFISPYRAIMTPSYATRGFFIDGFNVTDVVVETQGGTLTVYGIDLAGAQSPATGSQFYISRFDLRLISVKWGGSVKYFTARLLRSYSQPATHTGGGTLAISDCTVEVGSILQPTSTSAGAALSILTHNGDTWGWMREIIVERNRIAVTGTSTTYGSFEVDLVDAVGVMTFTLPNSTFRVADNEISVDNVVTLSFYRAECNVLRSIGSLFVEPSASSLESSSLIVSNNKIRARRITAASQIYLRVVHKIDENKHYAGWDFVAMDDNSVRVTEAVSTSSSFDAYAILFYGQLRGQGANAANNSYLSMSRNVISVNYGITSVSSSVTMMTVCWVQTKTGVVLFNNFSTVKFDDNVIEHSHLVIVSGSATIELVQLRGELQLAPPISSPTATPSLDSPTLSFRGGAVTNVTATTTSSYIYVYCVDIWNRLPLGGGRAVLVDGCRLGGGNSAFISNLYLYVVALALRGNDGASVVASSDAENSSNETLLVVRNVTIALSGTVQSSIRSSTSFIAALRFHSVVSSNNIRFNISVTQCSIAVPNIRSTSSSANVHVAPLLASSNSGLIKAFSLTVSENVASGTLVAGFNSCDLHLLAAARFETAVQISYIDISSNTVLPETDIDASPTSSEALVGAAYFARGVVSDGGANSSLTFSGNNIAPSLVISDRALRIAVVQIGATVPESGGFDFVSVTDNSINIANRAKQDNTGDLDIAVLLIRKSFRGSGAAWSTFTASRNSIEVAVAEARASYNAYVAIVVTRAAATEFGNFAVVLLESNTIVDTFMTQLSSPGYLKIAFCWFEGPVVSVAAPSLSPLSLPSWTSRNNTMRNCTVDLGYGNFYASRFEQAASFTGDVSFDGDTLVDIVCGATGSTVTQSFAGVVFLDVLTLNSASRLSVSNIRISVALLRAASDTAGIHAILQCAKLVRSPDSSLRTISVENSTIDFGANIPVSLSTVFGKIFIATFDGPLPPSLRGLLINDNHLLYPVMVNLVATQAESAILRLVQTQWLTAANFTDPGAQIHNNRLSSGSGELVPWTTTERVSVLRLTQSTAVPGNWSLKFNTFDDSVKSTVSLIAISPSSFSNIGPTGSVGSTVWIAIDNNTIPGTSGRVIESIGSPSSPYSINGSNIVVGCNNWTCILDKNFRTRYQGTAGTMDFACLQFPPPTKSPSQSLTSTHSESLTAQETATATRPPTRTNTRSNTGNATKTPSSIATETATHIDTNSATLSAETASQSALDTHSKSLVDTATATHVDTGTLTVPPSISHSPSNTVEITATRTIPPTRTKSRTITPGPTTTTAAPVTTTTTVAPFTPGPSIFDSGFVASIPSCPEALGRARCQLTHHQSGGCRCPAPTQEQNISMLSSYAFLPSSSSTSRNLGNFGLGCVRNPLVLGICTSPATASTEPFVSAYVRGNGATAPDLGGDCVVANPATGDCSCPANRTKVAFGFAAGTSASSWNKRFVTFCLPPQWAAFWTRHPEAAPTSSGRAEISCVQPDPDRRGKCECPGSNPLRSSAPVAVFPDNNAAQPVSGDLTLCKAGPVEPEEETEPGVTVTVTVATVIGSFIDGGGGNAIVGLQAASLFMTLCGANKSQNNTRSIVTFTEIPQAGEAGGFAFMLTLSLSILVFHLLCAFLLALKRHMEGAAIEDDADRVDYFTEPILVPTFAEQMQFASLQVRFPHWSFFVINISFSGVAVESTILVQKEDTTLRVIGIIGLALCAFYTALTFYLSYSGLRNVADPVIFIEAEAAEVMKAKAGKLLASELAQQRRRQSLHQSALNQFQFGATNPLSEAAAAARLAEDEEEAAKREQQQQQQQQQTNQQQQELVNERDVAAAVLDAHNESEERTQRNRARARRHVHRSRSNRHNENETTTIHNSSNGTNHNNNNNSGDAADLSAAATTTASTSGVHEQQRDRLGSSVFNAINGEEQLQQQQQPSLSAFSEGAASARRAALQRKPRASILHTSEQQQQQQEQQPSAATDNINHNSNSDAFERRSNANSSSKVSFAHKEEGDVDDGKDQDDEDESSLPSSADAMERKRQAERIAKLEAMVLEMQREKMNATSTSVTFSQQQQQQQSSTFGNRSMISVKADDEAEDDEEEMEQQDAERVAERLEHESHWPGGKPPHFVHYGKALVPLQNACGGATWVLPLGWWTKFRLYNRRFASMYNSFKPRPTAWTPTVIRVFSLLVAVASSVGECTVPLIVAGSFSLAVGVAILLVRPCRRPLDNILLASQLVIAGTLAFARTSDEDVSVKLFYCVVAVTFLYVIHIVILEALEAVAMQGVELLRFSQKQQETSMSMTLTAARGRGGNSSNQQSAATFGHGASTTATRVVDAGVVVEEDIEHENETEMK